MLIDSIPDVIDVIRSEKGIPLSIFSLDKDLNEEKQKQDIAFLLNPTLADKNAKVKKELTKEDKKKQKTPEEITKLFEKCKEETIEKLNEMLFNKMRDTFLDIAIDNIPQFRRCERKNLSELVDKISRKKTSEHINISSSRLLLFASLKVKNIPIESQELTIEHFDAVSLEDLKNLLQEIFAQYPKLVFLMLKFEYKDKKCCFSGKCVADYLIKETELKINQESGPFIQNFEEKLENNFYEEGSLIMIDNFAGFKEFDDSYVDEFNLKRSVMWSNIKQAGKELSKIGRILIDTDIDSFFKYSPLPLSVLAEEKILGGKIKVAIDFVKNVFIFEKTQKERLLVLGGKFTEEKCIFLMNSMSFFTKIKLYGKIGLYWNLICCKIENNFITPMEKNMILKICKLSNENNKEIEFCTIFSTLVFSDEGQFESLKINETPYFLHSQNELKFIELTSDMKLNRTISGNYIIDKISDNTENTVLNFIVDIHEPLKQQIVNDFAKFSCILM